MTTEKDAEKKKPLIPREKAEEEVTAWLDRKKIFEATRERNEDNIEILIEGIMTGVLTLDDQGKFTHNLLFPDGDLTQLVYRPRLNDNLLQGPLTGVKTSDGDGRLLAHVAALTDTSKALLKKLDSADKKIYLSIAVFFL